MFEKNIVSAIVEVTEGFNLVEVLVVTDKVKEGVSKLAYEHLQPILVKEGVLKEDEKSPPMDSLPEVHAELSAKGYRFNSFTTFSKKKNEINVTLICSKEETIVDFKKAKITIVKESDGGIRFQFSIGELDSNRTGDDLTDKDILVGFGILPE